MNQLLEELNQQKAYFAELEKISKVVDEEIKNFRLNLEKKRSKCNNAQQLTELDDSYKKMKGIFFFIEVLFPYMNTSEYIRKYKKWDKDYIINIMLSDDSTEKYPDGNAYDLYDRILSLPAYWKDIFLAIFNSESIRCANAIASGNSKDDFVEGCTSLDKTIFNKILSYVNVLSFSLTTNWNEIDDESDFIDMFEIICKKLSLPIELRSPIKSFVNKFAKGDIQLSDCIELLKLYSEFAGLPIHQLDERERNILDNILRHPSFINIYEEVHLVVTSEIPEEKIDFTHTPILVKELKPCWKEGNNLLNLADFVVTQGYIDAQYKNTFVYLFSGDPKFAPGNIYQKPYFTCDKSSDIMYIVKYIASNKVRNCWDNLAKYIELNELLAWKADRPNEDLRKFFFKIDPESTPKGYK